MHSVKRLVGTAVPSLLLGMVLATAAHAAEAPPTHAPLFKLRGEVKEPGRIFLPPPEGQFEDACGVAVDSVGDVYLSDYYHHLIDIYGPGPDHEYLTQITDPDPDGPCNLALDDDPASPSFGDLYVNHWHRDVVRYSPSEFPPTKSTTYGNRTVIDSDRPTGLAVDPASGDLFVDDRTYVAEYDPSGAPVQAGGEPLQIGLDPDASYYGAAISGFSSTAGLLYLANAARHAVEVFDPSAPLTPVEVIKGEGTPQTGLTNLIDSNLAVDPTDGHVFVVDENEPFAASPGAVVDEFNAAGAYRGQITGVIDAGPSELAVNAAGDLYISSGNSEEAEIDVFGPTFAAHSLEIDETGAGVVSSEPAGIRCGDACKAEYDVGEEMTLTAVPAYGSAFVGWSGGVCSGRVCHLTLNADAQLSAEFEALPQKTLSVTAEGAGAVTSEPAGIQCGGACVGSFVEGDAVTLTAKPVSPGSLFSGWKVNGSSTACPGTGSCTVQMSEAKSVVASFEAVPVHTLGVEVTGAGAVTSEPAGIQCGTTCSAEYDQGTEVTLTAIPRPHQAFTGWSGPGCSGTTSCTVTVGADTTINAGFAPTQHTLSVGKIGSGQGSVTSGPAGIQCGGTCSKLYEEGTQVALSATAAPGSTFTGWSGPGCSGTEICLVILGADTSITAQFTRNPTPAHEEVPPPSNRFALGQPISGVGGTAASILAVLPGPGTLSTSGSNLLPASAPILASGPETLRLTLSHAGRKALRGAKGNRLKVKVTFVFTPNGGAPSAMTKDVTFLATGGTKGGQAEITRRGDLFAVFSGGISPSSLPRHRLAPIAVSISGTVTSASSAEPPALRKIAIEVNRAGHLDTHGLPICRPSQLKATNSRQALAACGSALVGSGSYVANTTFPEQHGFPSQGRILAFNSLDGGRRVILVHTYGTEPAPITRIIAFHIQLPHGTHGAVLTGTLPPTVNRYGYLESISLELHRTFSYRGTLRSYLSAACPAPQGFTAALFPLSRTTLSFADGSSLSGTLIRSCKASE